MSDFRNIVRCKNCEAITHYPHRLGLIDAYVLNDQALTFCRACASNDGWFDSVESWVSEARLLNPFSWGRGHWIKKEMK